MTAIYDVCVVGAGPAGSTCAFYLARQGKRVLLLEKKTFPRDKLCGDAVVPRAQLHLRDMGVYQELVDHGEAVFARSGGFVSPGGVECMGDSSDNPNGLVMAVKRTHLDARCAWAAQRAGAVLTENVSVTGVEQAPNGHWTIRAGSQSWHARVVVAADGAHSRLARSLGVVEGPPDSICSRAFVEGGTHDFDLDGVVYMPRRLLPGYAALFRHPNDELNYCCYILPGGACTTDDLQRMHHELLEQNPFLRKHLGPRFKIERMRGAWLRCGGVKKSYARNLLVVGDAAGQTDPLTGEGIQFAMDGAREAAETLRDAFVDGDFSEALLSRYQRRWMAAFGNDFRISHIAARAMARFPGAVDAMAKATLAEGSDFFRNWTDVMTGSRSWGSFAKPAVALPIARQLMRQIGRPHAFAH
jgi:geranylgeranyl reductase family protein